MTKFSLNLNGHSQTVDAPPEMPLLWVLRDRLALTGTKYGCGIGACGACTVHIDDAPARACLVPIKAVANRRVVTVEGLSPNHAHPVQRAWRELRVPQCGYCQSGQMMTAAAFIAETTAPTDKQIREAMQGNLCRCGTYPRIAAAVARAAELARETSS
jgi:isoquinoline 1-oxidoreductase alpha subunit